MSFITTKDGTEIFFKDWGPKDAQPIVFHHGWPLSADDWDAQLIFFLNQGFRVIAHDRRGHGRSTQTDTGNEMDTYAADVAELVTALDLKNAVHIGHSTGGGECVHYVARAEPGRVAKAVIIGAVPPVMVKKEFEPGRDPDRGVRRLSHGARSQPRAALPRYRQRPLLRLQPAGRANLRGHRSATGSARECMGGIKAHYDCIKAFSETDFTEDLKAIEVPVAVLHGDDDQIVPYADSGPLSAKLLKNGMLKTYKGYPHGMATTHAERSTRTSSPSSAARISEPISRRSRSRSSPRWLDCVSESGEGRDLFAAFFARS